MPSAGVKRFIAPGGRHTAFRQSTFLRCGCTVLATEIRVLSVGTVRVVLRELIPEYVREVGNRVQVVFGNPAVILEHLAQGKPADIAMVAGALWGQAVKLGRLNAETKTIFPATPSLRNWNESRDKTFGNFDCRDIPASLGRGQLHCLGRPQSVHGIANAESR
jgi:hypothetical protein